MLATLNAERIKLQSTRAPVWTTLSVAVLSLGFAAIQAGGLPYSYLSPERAALGVSIFGVPVLMILSALSVTSEFRTGMIRATFLATPRRGVVLTAKAAVAAAFSGVVTAIMMIGAIGLARSLLSSERAGELDLSGSEVWRAVGATSLYAALGAVLAVALGALMRHTAGVVAVLVLMPFVVEPLLGTIPQIGGRVGPLLPFSNAYTFTETPWFQTFTMWWGPVGAALYFAAVVATVFVAALVTLVRRDP
ncbi:ABC transporter permease [Mycolicibacterium aubagnense]|uniref:ABC transporter permease n=1 Tax=Mycolicibacterium aubagnense TaxID=319707 RepID=A0ABN5YT60_9MYCO|nr:ABC transporter permease [Mycolicibacterium aubagnense]TLH50215.1 ABC transporter permease [Mycolicibacterium aubagnense]WGI33599.1 ABC transporter permease [Mycolicibacterium aubagnense]BBX84656.1 ABC transporter permease [Mycolicibacterium aubagnense]